MLPGPPPMLSAPGMAFLNPIRRLPGLYPALCVSCSASVNDFLFNREVLWTLRARPQAEAGCLSYGVAKPSRRQDLLTPALLCPTGT